MKMRLEAIDAQHTDTVALMRGPLVLMAVKRVQGAPAVRMTREQLLAAEGERTAVAGHCHRASNDGSVYLAR